MMTYAVMNISDCLVLALKGACRILMRISDYAIMTCNILLMSVRQTNYPAFSGTDDLITLNKIGIEVSSRQNRVGKFKVNKFGFARVVRFPETCRLMIINGSLYLLRASTYLAIFAGRGLRFIRMITLLRRLGDE